MKQFTGLCLVLVLASCSGFIRLNGPQPGEGRAEFLNPNAIWGTICDRAFVKEGWPSVFCHQLGFPGIVSATYIPAARKTTGPITFHSPVCNPSNAKHMAECKQDSNPTCTHLQDVYIKCSGVRKTTVRLAGGSGANEGRAEFLKNGVWGSICDVGFVKEGWPSVLCHELGFPGIVSATYATASQRGTGAVTYQSPLCSLKTASFMAECGRDRVPACNHLKDVYVKCAPKSASTVRLVDGPTTGEGRVELIKNGQWGSICDNAFVKEGWPSVVCHELGFSGIISATYATASQRGTGSITFHSPVCSLKNAQHMGQCKQDSNPTCTHLKDVWIKCVGGVPHRTTPKPTTPKPTTPKPTTTEATAKPTTEEPFVLCDKINGKCVPEKKCPKGMVSAFSKGYKGKCADRTKKCCLDK